MELVDITAANWKAVVSLTTITSGPRRMFEDFVASNVFSLAQVAYEPWIAKGLVAEGKLVASPCTGIRRRSGNRPSRA